MNFQRKLQIDRTFGRVLLHLLSPFNNLLTNRKSSENGPIVITKIIGMGSLIQATPLFQSLKEQYPEKKIILITSTSNKKFASLIPWIDEILKIEEKSIGSLIISTLRAIHITRRVKPFAHIDLEVYSNFSAAITALCGSPRKVGFYRVSPKPKEKIYTDLIFFNTARQIRETYLKTCTVLSGKTLPLREIPKMTVSDEETTQWNLAKKENDINRPFIVVNTNASDLLLERRWPTESFAQLIESLTNLGHNIILTGSPSEKHHVDNVENLCPNATASNHLKNLAGKLSLEAFIGCLREAKLIITNDTGPMHLGAALKTPTLSLWGPGNPKHYGFLPEENIHIISKNLFCSPCLYEVEPPPCRGNNICMKTITPKEVEKKALHLLNQSPPSNPKTEIPTEENPPEAGVHKGKGSPAPCPYCKTPSFSEIIIGGFPVHRCPSCKSLFSFPQPSDNELEEIYNEAYYHTWGTSKNGEDVRITKKNLFKTYLQKVGVSLQNKNCLDCGAATGHMMEAAQESGANVYGVEINPGGISKLEEKFGISKIFQGQIEDLASSKFPPMDFVFMFDYLEHVRDPESTLRAATSALNPGGVILGTTPAANCFSETFLGKAWPHLKPEHLTYPSKEGLKILAKTCGVEARILQPNKKTLPINYILSVLATYKIPGFGPMADIALKHLPKTLLAFKIRLPSGETLFLLQKA